MKKHVRSQMVRIQSLAGKAKVGPAKVKPGMGAKSNQDEALNGHGVADPIQRLDTELDLMHMIGFIRRFSPSMADVLLKRMFGFSTAETAMAMCLDKRRVERLYRSAKAILNAAFRGTFP